MSIFNVFITPTLATVGFDTEGTLPDGSHIEGAKTVFLPHISAVVGFRGPADFLAFTSPAIIGFSGDFDNLADRLPEIIRGSRAAFIAHYGADAPNVEAASNFVLVGFSTRAGRMIGHAFECAEKSSDITEYHDFPQLFSPFFGAEAIARLGIRADRAGMIDLALDQCRLVRERDPALPAGGRLFIAEIRKGAITIEEVCGFPTRGEPTSEGAPK